VPARRRQHLDLQAALARRQVHLRHQRLAALGVAAVHQHASAGGRNRERDGG
jgi:hypothetical protein